MNRATIQPTFTGVQPKETTNMSNNTASPIDPVYSTDHAEIVRNRFVYTCYHEAAHAVIHALQGGTITLVSAVADDEEGYDGIMKHKLEYEISSEFHLLVTLWAGLECEILMHPIYDLRPFIGDKYRILLEAAYWAKVCLPSAPGDSAQVRRRMFHILLASRQQARRLVRTEAVWNIIQAVASALREHGTLTQEEFEAQVAVPIEEWRENDLNAGREELQRRMASDDDDLDMGLVYCGLVQCVAWRFQINTDDDEVGQLLAQLTPVEQLLAQFTPDEVLPFPSKEYLDSLYDRIQAFYNAHAEEIRTARAESRKAYDEGCPSRIRTTSATYQDLRLAPLLKAR
jgi:hypothetical protein